MSNTNLTASATISRTRSMLDGKMTLHVDVYWKGVEVDRPSTCGWALTATPSNERLAHRLIAAIEAGAVFSDPEIKTDVNGLTYVASKGWIVGRRLNAGLRDLGY